MCVLTERRCSPQTPELCQLGVRRYGMLERATGTTYTQYVATHRNVQGLPVKHASAVHTQQLGFLRRGKMQVQPVLDLLQRAAQRPHVTHPSHTLGCRNRLALAGEHTARPWSALLS